jgi:hypothetical protein
MHGMISKMPMTRGMGFLIRVCQTCWLDLKVSYSPLYAERCSIRSFASINQKAKRAMKHILCNLIGKTAAGHLTTLLQHTVYDILFTKKPKNPI